MARASREGNARTLARGVRVRGVNARGVVRSRACGAIVRRNERRASVKARENGRHGERAGAEKATGGDGERDDEA